MRSIQISLLASFLVVTLTAGGGSAWASSLYVDPENGTDASNSTCGQSLATPSTGPCATLNNALSHASAGDTIYVERGGSFGPIYLTGQIAIVGTEEKSVVIQNNGSAPGCIGGAPGSCNAGGASNAGIEIVAGATDSVKLKNLLVNSGSGGVAAIRIQSAFSVALNGIALRSSNNSSLAALLYDVSSQPTSGSPHQVYMHGLELAYNSSGGGILFQPSVSSSLHISNSELHNLKFGLKVIANSVSSGSVAAVIDETEFFSFNGDGVLVTATGAASGNVSLNRSSISQVGTAGVFAGGANANLLLYEDVISVSNIGVQFAGLGEHIYTLGNNQLFFNGTPVTGGTLTAAPAGVGGNTQ